MTIPFTNAACRPIGGVVIAALLSLAGPLATPAAQQRGEATAFPCDLQTTERIVANVHGAYRAFDPSLPAKTPVELLIAMAEWRARH